MPSPYAISSHKRVCCAGVSPRPLIELLRKRRAESAVEGADDEASEADAGPKLTYAMDSMGCQVHVRSD